MRLAQTAIVMTACLLMLSCESDRSGALSDASWDAGGPAADEDTRTSDLGTASDVPRGDVLNEIQAPSSLSTLQQHAASARCERPQESWSPVGSLEYADLIVTAADVYVSNSLSGLYVQEASGGAWSGLFLTYFVSCCVGVVPELEPGDVVRIWGDWEENRCQTRIQAPAQENGIEKTGSGASVNPVSVDVKSLMNDSDYAESFEGVLVVISNQTVASAPNGDNGWSATLDSGVVVDDAAFYQFEDVALGEGVVLPDVVGVWAATARGEDDYVLLPRGAGDFRN